ncbi:MAG: phosphoglycerate dehydrogenase [Bdellovibrionales bacterium]
MDKVLILDSVDEKAAEILSNAGFHVDAFDTKNTPPPEKLKTIISEYAAVIVRSNTKITPDILNAATNLKVIGRAGSGVDNIAVPSATAKGILVMNADGNTISAAEHALAMMMALSRNITVADVSMKEGRWDKKHLTGVEVNNKTLGIFGLGRVGKALAERAIGLNMTVLAYDPFLSKEAAEKVGVTLVDNKEDLLKKADFISLHTVKLDEYILGSKEFSQCKKGVRIINCARDGLMDSEALLEAVEKGIVAGVALDVFENEPLEKGKGNPFEEKLVGLQCVIATPHLGASTSDAQVRVAEMIATQVRNYLTDGTIAGAVNAPSLTAEERSKLGAHLMLASQLGSFVGQIMPEGRLQKIDIDYAGGVAEVNRKPVTSAAVEWLLRSQNIQANQINALAIAKDRSIAIEETVVSDEKNYQTLIRIRVETDKGTTQVAGTLINKEPSIVSVDDIQLEAKIAGHMLFARNNNKPGMIGIISTILGVSGLNIKNIQMGETPDKTENISFFAVDREITQPVLAELIEAKQDGVKEVRVLNMSPLIPVRDCQP